ncbi:UNVERIFIED_CONTAM: hypothetical protein FKN15_001040 [Acipenser sinensis]
MLVINLCFRESYHDISTSNRYITQKQCIKEPGDPFRFVIFFKRKISPSLG